MARYILFYDSLNDILIRTTSNKLGEKLIKNFGLKKVGNITGNNIHFEKNGKNLNIPDYKKFLSTNLLNTTLFRYENYFEGTGKNKHVKVIKLLDDLFLCWSFKLKDSKDRESIIPTITFDYYNGEDKCVSYNPFYGPISIFSKTPDENKSVNKDLNLDGIESPHYLLGEIFYSNLTELEVSESDIGKAVLNGNYIEVRNILKNYYY